MSSFYLAEYFNRLWYAKIICSQDIKFTIHEFRQTFSMNHYILIMRFDHKHTKLLSFCKAATIILADMGTDKVALAQKSLKTHQG